MIKIIFYQLKGNIDAFQENKIKDIRNINKSIQNIEKNSIKR